MAQLTTPSAIALAATDLNIEICPRYGYVFVKGTRAQLVIEGLVPAGIVWPDKYAQVCWEDKAFSYTLYRGRPLGAKGPRSAFADADCWCLYRARLGYNMVSANLEHKFKELVALLKPGHTFSDWAAVGKAQRDTAYQTFRTQTLGELAPRKRGRKPKATTQTRQGAAA